MFPHRARQVERPGTLTNTLFTWGLGTSGQLGNNSTTARSSPVQVAGNIWAQVSTGSNGSAAVRTDNTLWTWGVGGLGQMGNNATTNRSSPVQVAGTTWAQVSVGSDHVAAVRTNGELWSWGLGT
jgi:alpha-tubulin suppressor-like RCC1 family protein